MSDINTCFCCLNAAQHTRGPERTVDVQQHSPRFSDDDRPSGDVPAMDPDLEEGLHRPGRHQAHVGGRRPGPTQPVGSG